MKPLHHVLSDLQKQVGWQTQQQFQVLQQLWAEIVGPVVAAQTRPAAITEQGVLKVATSSSVWAHNLSFERQRILTKLNTHLAKPLTGLYFTTSLWQIDPPIPRPDTGLIQPFPQPPDPQPPPAKSPTPPTDPLVAFQRWSTQIKGRSSQLPLCPQCQCPTPLAEMARWQQCGLCAARSQPGHPREL